MGLEVARRPITDIRIKRIERLTAWIQDAPLVSMDLLFDMETRDPDDVLTLCLVATHPGVRLVGVTVNPGTPSQIGVVRHLLERTGREDVRIGARTPKADREAVSPFHRTGSESCPRQRQIRSRTSSWPRYSLVTRRRFC